MRKYLPYAAATAFFGVCAPACALEGWTGAGALTALSDYRWRGASMTDERPAIQAGFDVAHDSGFWAWAGGGNVADDYGGTELGIALGWAGAAAGFDWSLGAEQTAYPANHALDYYQATAEIGRSFEAVTVSAGLEYAPAQASLSEDDRYFWIGGAVEAARNVTARARIGKNSGAFASANGAVDYEAGVTVALAGVDIDIAHVGADAADGSFVFSLTARR